MAIGQACLVKVSSPSGAVLARWSSHWVGQVITWQSTTWRHQPMGWTVAESESSLSLPRVPSLEQLTSSAAEQRYLVELIVYQFDEEDGATGPPAEMTEASQFVGQVIGSTRTYSDAAPSITWRLGTIPDGNFPPVVGTSFLIGVPCVL